MRVARVSSVAGSSRISTWPRPCCTRGHGQNEAPGEGDHEGARCGEAPSHATRREAGGRAAPGGEPDEEASRRRDEPHQEPRARETGAPEPAPRAEAPRPARREAHTEAREEGAAGSIREEALN